MLTHWLFVSFFIGVVLLLVGGGFYVVYNEQAEQSFATLDPEPLLMAGDLEGAIKMYERFVAQNPWTEAQAQAKAEIRWIEELKRRSNWNSDVRWRARGRIENTIDWSLQKLESSIERETGGRFNADTDATLRRLRRYVKSSRRLQAMVYGAARAGDWEKARAHALRLKEKYPHSEAARSTPTPHVSAAVPSGPKN